MSDAAGQRLRELLEARFAGRRPLRAVRAGTHALGWLARRLPRSLRVRAALDRALGPIIARWIRGNPAMFDAVPPSDEQLRGGARLTPFLHAVHAWLGVEASVMRYGTNFRLPVIESQACVERLYRRDEAGMEQGGCPWGLGSAEDGFACRTIMTGSRHVFDSLGHAKMKVDIGIPEMLAVERLVVEHLCRQPGATAHEVEVAIELATLEIFQASKPEEDDFFVEGRPRAETAAVIREIIAAIISGRKPALFCQFRLVP